MSAPARRARPDACRALLGRLRRALHDTSTPAVHSAESGVRPATIFALSSGAARAAVAVVRLSGPASDEVLRRLLAPGRALPPPRTASLASLLHPETGQPLDRALVLRFPHPRSFTGEDCAELHVHGGPAVVRALLYALGTLPGLRPAAPGEFARRAFEAGKLDLTAAEGLADLLAAETEAQRRQALLHASGAVAARYAEWRAALLTCLARVEAVIDFGEDEGIADDVAAGVAPMAAALRASLQSHLAAGVGGELVRDGVRVALAGPPNAGKSSLLNALAGRDAAIVSPLAGTTRDVLEVALDLGGYKVVLTDSAGIRDTECPVEAEGVRRARASVQHAQIVVHVADASVQQQRQAGVQQACMHDWPIDAEHAQQLWVLNKCDLLAAGSSPAESTQMLLSCKTGEGLEGLLAALTQHVQAVVGGSGCTGSEDAALVARARHRHHMQAAVDALLRYEAAPLQLETAAEELREAARALGRVTGAIDTEAVLDAVFSEFCIGK